MSDGIKLTLDPMGDENKQELDTAVAAAVQATEALEQAETEAKQEVQQATLDMQSFSDEEQKMIDDFSEKIDVRDSNLVFSYGAAAQSNISEFSTAALGTVRTKDLGPVGSMLSDLVVELKGLNFPAEEKKGFKGLFKKASNNIATLKAQYQQDMLQYYDAKAENLDFKSPTALSTINLPNNLTKIGVNAFSGCGKTSGPMILSAADQSFSGETEADGAPSRNQASTLPSTWSWMPSA